MIIPSLLDFISFTHIQRLSAPGAELNAGGNRFPSSATVKAGHLFSHDCFGKVQMAQFPLKRFRRGESSLSVVSYQAE
jgi:hypothetical protein